MNKQLLETLKSKFINKKDEQSLHIMSFLYRYEDNYDAENYLIKTASQLYPQNEYFILRLSWHNLPVKDKKVAREQILLTEKQPWHDEMIAKTTFVTGCDANPMFFEMLCNLLLSLKGLNVFNRIDINLVDCGMTNSQKNYLMTNFNVKNIFKPVIKVPIKRGYMHPELISRPFVNDYFPGYQYYFHFDTDTWVQDEYAIERILLLTQAQGIGGACHTRFFSSEELSHLINSDKLIVERQNAEVILKHEELVINSMPYNAFQDTYIVNPGAVCIDVNKPFFKEWRANLLEILRTRGAGHLHEEVALNHSIINNLPLKILAPYDNFLMAGWNQYSSLLSKKGTLFSIKDKVLGIIHLNGSKKHYLSDFEVYDHEFEEAQRISFHFKVWPWADKKEIENTLREMKVI